MPLPAIDRFRGIHAATVCPLLPDGRIDEDALARHLAKVSNADGITGLLINGHAGENFMLSREDKRRVVAIARRACPSHTLLVCGINAEDSLQAQAHVDDAVAEGADAVLVFPPFSWALSQDSELAVRHHAMATAHHPDFPLFVYQAGVRAGSLGYTADVLERLVQLPNVVGIKDGSWETAAYEANRRLIQRVAPHVLVMASGDEHLLTCFAIGTEGSLVSLACVSPELVVGLYRAMQAGDLALARQFNDRIYPLAKAIYGTAPGGHANARLKTCLKLLGHIESDAMRPPMGPLPEAEVAMLAAALKAAGL
ncbi:MAG: dihydrodipicolinate synthetase [Rhizobacter sp.]|nr:dihydrodipicolinate synthetase [Rhizobacter sp.]